MKAYFTLAVLMVALLVWVDGISKLAVHISQLDSVLTSLRICEIFIFWKIVTTNGTLSSTWIIIVREFIQHLESISTIISASASGWLAWFDLVWFSFITLSSTLTTLAVIKEAHLLRIKSLISRRIEICLYITLRPTIISDQVLVHRQCIKLSFEVINFLLLYIKLISFL